MVRRPHPILSAAARRDRTAESSGHFGYSTQPRPLHEPLETPPGFGSAPVFWRFGYGREPNVSARGLAQSMTLPREPRVHGSNVHEVVGALREPHFLPRRRSRPRPRPRSIGLISRTKTSTRTRVGELPLTTEGHLNRICLALEG